MSRVPVTAALAVALVLAPLGVVAAGATAAGVQPAAGVASTAGAVQTPNPCVGTVRERPDRATVVSIQGAHAGEKTDAMLVSVAPSGPVVGVHNADDYGRWWAYDVDRLPNGNFLMSTTQSRHTVIEEVDDETGEHVSVRHFRDVHDTHDVDLINSDELVMNDMGDEHNRVLVYNLTREEIVWEYRFDEHTDAFPKDGGGPYGKDWTHNNDVEQIRPGVFMVSLKNFDQVVAIDRSTKEVLWRLGADDELSILHKQHNPDYLRTEGGRATVLVADSRNDRVVEYTREDGEWNRTWVLQGGGLDEPRDADRLPSGNTLVVDRHGHRMLEVTPDGRVLWEFYLPYQPYDAERLGTPDESSGPTMVDAGETGVVELDSESVAPGDLEACYDFLTNVSDSRLVPADDPGVATDEPAGDGETGTDGTTGTGSDGDGGDGSGSDGGSDAGDGDGTDDESALGTPDARSSSLPSWAPVAVALVVLAAVGVGAVWRRRNG